MDEAEQLCDRLVIMDEAHIVAEGSPRDLISTYVTREVVEVRFPLSAERDEVAKRVGQFAERVEPLADRVLLYTHDGDGTVASVTKAGFDASAVLVRRASLEDVFLILTGRSLED
jgi:lipooligosaccharide transport system ATP-binding protein